MERKLILGTVQFGQDYGINNNIGKPSDLEMKSILDFAYEQGVTFLDTAEAYGDSQQRIGRYHQDSNNKFSLITKYSSQIDLPNSIIKRVEHNIYTLHVDKLYGYMFHSFKEYETYYSRFKNDLNDMVKSNLIGKLGVSVYTNEEAMRVLDNESIGLIQIPFNLLDNFYKRESVLLKAKERGVEVHTRSVFLQGLFFRDLNDIPNNLNSLEPYLKLILELAKNNDISVQSLSLNYTLMQLLISKVLVGVDSLYQLQENIKSSSKDLEEAIVKDIDMIDVQEIELLNPANWK